MNVASCSFRLLACLAGASLLDACSLFPASTEPADYGHRKQVLQARREQNFQSIWRGKPYNALLESFGAPQLLMNVPGQRALPTSVAVYGIMDNLSQCVDAFTLVVVHEGEVVIADYFCR
ncbi:hypothetical protein [Noviherbaspirillum sp. UKPF54]|uniref:hypothetical protein n=1 Tax=Noviherbaspirillum sp. UKPF54 TaxID=2601898 RepID=UPI0011B1729F|nr:hypothetical protein [Noviherbaspirillum sp. UKPF54]QDZ27197.1 hypothetical protein FAY22_04055 [Noviherbaspirillum sp. UKPF54]